MRSIAPDFLWPGKNTSRQLKNQESQRSQNRSNNVEGGFDDEFGEVGEEAESILNSVDEQSYIEQLEYYTMLRDEGKYVLIQTLDDSNYPGFIIDVGAGYLECYVLTNFYVDGNEGRQEAVQTRHRIDFTMIVSVQEDYAKMLPPDAKRVASFIRRNVLKIRPIPGSEWSDPVEEVHVKKVAKKSPRLKKKSAEPIDRADQV